MRIVIVGVLVCLAVACDRSAYRVAPLVYEPGHALERVPPPGTTPIPYHSASPPAVESVPFGTILWTSVISDWRYGPRVISSGERLYLRKAHAIVAFALKTNAILWRTVDDAFPIAASGDDLYAFRPKAGVGVMESSLGGTLIAINASSGRERWHKVVRNGGSAAADSDGIVLSSGQVGGSAKLMAWRRDGSLQWQTAISDRYDLSFYGSKIIGLAVRDGARMAGELGAFDRNSGRYLGSNFSFSHLLSFDQPDIVYGQDDLFGDPGEVCCSAALIKVFLRQGVMRGYPPVRMLASVPRVLEPDLRSNEASSKRCRLQLDYSMRDSSNARIDRLGRGFVVWIAGTIYDVRTPSTHKTAVADECPISESNGNAMLAARRNSLDVISRRGRELDVRAVLPVHRESIVAALATPEAFYVQVGDWLYSIDAKNEHARARWHIACNEWSFVRHLNDRDVLACVRRSRDMRQSLYALSI